MRDIQFEQEVLEAITRMARRKRWKAGRLTPGRLSDGTDVLRVSKGPAEGWPPEHETVYVTLEAADRGLS